MHPDHSAYLRFCSRANLIKEIDSISGLVKGIDIDREINPVELGFLYDWIDAHAEVRNRHPFNEIVPVIVGALEDGVLTADEKNDLLWLCDRLASDEQQRDRVTADMRTLHGVLGGVAADAVIAERELDGLRVWLDDHEHLRKLWPYDEIDSLLTAVMADRRITHDEHSALLMLFSEFVSSHDRKTIVDVPVSDAGVVSGVCAACPEIEFDGHVFCFTGASARYRREELVEMICERGGECSNSVTRKTDYLVVGAEGNPCWSYACYGRKVEAAVNLRKKGFPILIVHEHDFRDALADTAATA